MKSRDAAESTFHKLSTDDDTPAADSAQPMPIMPSPATVPPSAVSQAERTTISARRRNDIMDRAVIASPLLRRTNEERGSRSFKAAWAAKWMMPAEGLLS